MQKSCVPDAFLLGDLNNEARVVKICQNDFKAHPAQTQHLAFHSKHKVVNVDPKRLS